LVEIPLAKRQKGAELQRLLEKEGTKMLKAVSKGAYVIALDVGGQQKSTQRLAEELDQWMRLGRNVAFLVGGPDGLAPECLKRADEVWSLSALTLPHPLVRVILSEQMYRAMSIIKNHPYHR
jgi:23S rRNA (pseudouridine1915-N3)-methyltransferase